MAKQQALNLVHCSLLDHSEHYTFCVLSIWNILLQPRHSVSSDSLHHSGSCFVIWSKKFTMSACLLVSISVSNHVMDTMPPAKALPAFGPPFVVSQCTYLLTRNCRSHLFSPDLSKWHIGMTYAGLPGVSASGWTLTARSHQSFKRALAKVESLLFTINFGGASYEKVCWNDTRIKLSLLCWFLLCPWWDGESGA